MLLIISSCSIEKRRYTGGFHVEWFNSTRHYPNVGRSEITSASDNHMEVDSLNQELRYLKASDTIAVSDSVVRSQQTEKSVYSKKFAPAISATATTKLNEACDSESGIEHRAMANEPRGKTLEEMTLLSFLIALMGFVIPWPLATLACFVSALSIAIAGRHRIMRNREKYSGAGLAIAAMLVAVFGLILFLWLLFVVGAFVF